MKHIKLFESIKIDKEEVKLWMVELLDMDFDIRVYSLSEEDDLVIELINKKTYQVNQIVDKLLFTTDMIKRKYNLELDNISLVSSPEITAGNYFNYHNLLHKVSNFNSIVDSTITNDTLIAIYYTPEVKGLKKYMKKFREFDPIQATKFVTNNVIKGVTKINSLLSK